MGSNDSTPSTRSPMLASQYDFARAPDVGKSGNIVMFCSKRSERGSMRRTVSSGTSPWRTFRGKSLLDACFAIRTVPSSTVCSSSAAGLQPVERTSALFWNISR